MTIEHSIHLQPSGGFGPWFGWRWVCCCGRKGVSMGSKQKAQDAGVRHERRAT